MLLFFYLFGGKILIRHFCCQFMKPIELFFPLLTEPANIVITTHQKPDGDAMGSSLALCLFLRQFHHNVTVISPTNWAAFLNWMPGCKDVIDFEKNSRKCSELITTANFIFCLDFNVLSRTKQMESLLQHSSAAKIIIDHHQQPQVDTFAYGISDTGKSSTCEMVYDFIVKSGHGDKITNEIAQCLYAGVMTDTGSFRFPSATSTVHRLVAHLKENGLHHSIIHENIYDNFLENRIRFLGHILLNRMEILYEYNIGLIAISKNDLLRFHIQTGDTEGLVNYPLSVQGIKMAALIIDRDEERKWSFRSKGNIDVNQFARQYFNGGGHVNAAGGRSNDSLTDSVIYFKSIIEKEKNIFI